MRKIIVDCDPGQDNAMGRTVVDAENLIGAPPNTAVMNDLDTAAFAELLEARPGRMSGSQCV